MAELMKANGRSLGVESEGKWQVRGNGDLVLTEDELVFSQWKPANTLRISRSAIVSVTGDERSHLGKNVGANLLKVTRTTEDGIPDSIALQMPDLDAWLRALGQEPPPAPSNP